jgi:hypothetical protein
VAYLKTRYEQLSNEVKESDAMPQQECLVTWNPKLSGLKYTAIRATQTCLVGDSSVYTHTRKS